tara:strand:+ start:1381 stop:1623 length:243 start_codon:yes stop_codon:yes gene_type:complete
MTDTTTRPTIPMKGSLVAAFANGDMLEMWFQSPTGDSSDSHQFAMRCNSPEQAEAIATLHRTKWGVPNYGDPATLTSERF